MARRMKDSGVEWIGEIPEEWEVGKMKSCTDIIMGQSPDSNDISSNGKLLFMQGNREFGEKYPHPSLYCDSCKKHSRIGDILLSVRAPVGAINESDKEYGIGRGLCSIKADTIENDFLKYYLVKSIDDLKYYSNGSTFEAITIDILRNFYVLLPNREEQEKIANILKKKVGEIDSIIVKTKETIEEYKKYKQAIITDTVTKGLNPDVEMKESGIEWIGEIPKHWKMLRIKNIAKEIGDGLHSTPEYDENGDVFFINGNNIGDEYLIVKENTNKLNETERRKYKLPLLSENTIMIALNGATYGKTSFYSGEKVLLGKSAGYITLKEMCNKKFIRYFLQSYSAKYFMALSLNGTTIQNLSLNTLNNFYITYPNKVEQQKIVDFLDIICSEIDKLITKKEKLLVDLENYKKSLIYEYVTGKKEVE